MGDPEFVRYHIGRDGLALMIDGPRLADGTAAEVRLVGTVRGVRRVDDDGCEYGALDFVVSDFAGPSALGPFPLNEGGGIGATVDDLGSGDGSA